MPRATAWQGLPQRATYCMHHSPCKARAGKSNRVPRGVHTQADRRCRPLLSIAPMIASRSRMISASDFPLHHLTPTQLCETLPWQSEGKGLLNRSLYPIRDNGGVNKGVGAVEALECKADLEHIFCQTSKRRHDPATCRHVELTFILLSHRHCTMVS